MDTRVDSGTIGVLEVHWRDTRGAVGTGGALEGHW